jgi:NAD(P)-dependent dehydrogenase (short-subunit alcohol dehydrogenase family)
MIAVDSWEGLSPEEKARRIEAIPMGREGRPADIAWAAVFLAADDAGFVTGQNFEVDGGMLVPGRSASAELGLVNTPENIGEF